MNPISDLEEWARRQSLSRTWGVSDLSRLAANPRASSALDVIHHFPDRQLGNVVAFCEMLLDRRLTQDEMRHAGGNVYSVQLFDLALHPYALASLIEHLDGLFRINDPSMTVLEKFASQEAYQLPEGFSSWTVVDGWFFSEPWANQRWERPIEGRKRDWDVDDFRLIPLARHLAWLELITLVPEAKLALTSDYSRAVYQREVAQQDLVSATRYVPREMALHPIGYDEMLQFVVKERELGRLSPPKDWREQFPDLVALVTEIESRESGQ